MTKFITSNNNYIWVLVGNRQYILLYADLPVIERLGKGWKFVLQTVFPIHDEFVDMIHGNDLAICHTDFERTDKFVEENIVVRFYNCVETDRRILTISQMSSQQNLVILETIFVSERLKCIT